jgi:hypothetical protein
MVLERTVDPPVPEPQPTAQERISDSFVHESEGYVNAEGKSRDGDKTENQLREPKQSHVTLLPHTALLKLMKSPRAVVSAILTCIWGLGWTLQETTVVLHLNRVWGLDPHQAGIAFIAAVVPTIFCEVWTVVLYISPYNVF